MVILVGLLLSLGAAAVAVGLFALASAKIPGRYLQGADNEAGTGIYGVVGMAMAILIALAGIAVWEPHSVAEQSSSREASALTEIYWIAQSFPPDKAADVRAKVVAYTKTVVDSEWRELREHHRQSPAAARSFTELRMAIEGVTPADEKQADARVRAMDTVADAADARRARLDVATASVPGLLWVVLVLGSVVTIGFLLLFGLSPSVPHMGMVALSTVMIVLLLFIIYQLEFPYSRGLQVESDDFRAVLDRIRSG